MTQNELKDTELPQLLEELSQQPAEEPIPTPEQLLSPTLAVLESEGKPAPSTVCRACPHAMWFTTEHYRACYCRIMQDQTYNDRSEKTAITITSCDGVIALPDPEL